MKRKILVPVDFSSIAHNAYLYARELAKVFNCTLEVIHTYTISYSQNTVASLMAEAGTIKSIERKMKEFVNNYPEEEMGSVLTRVVINTNIQEGNPVPIIVRESKADEVFMVVIGTTGKHYLGDLILGSVASSIAQKAHCPVLLIPEHISYKPFDGILYASNYEAANQEMLQEITNFANLFRASVHFVHVEEKEDKEDFSKTQEEIFNQLFKEGDPAFSFNMDVVKEDSVVKGLHKYADEHKIDLIVLVNNQRGFFNSLMGNSISKNMALDIRYPLMVYHYPKSA